MADITWIKLRTNMFDDEKIKIIERMPEGDSILITWVKLLAYAGKVNCNGFIMINENIPLNIEQVSIIFNRPFEKVKYAISVLQKFGMLDVSEDEIIAITNWEKHQNIEGMDKIRMQNRERKRLERERKKTLLLNTSEPEECHVTVTGRHATDIDLDKEKENNYLSVDKSTDVSKVIKFYKTLKNLPQPKKITTQREKHVNARITDFGLETVIELLDKFNKSKFVEQYHKEKRTYMSFDWIFSPQKFTFLAEGKYFWMDDVKNDLTKNEDMEDLFS